MPFGAIEDWNTAERQATRGTPLVAIAFRGDRGLELNTRLQRLELLYVAIAFRGDRGLEQLVGNGAVGTIEVAIAFRGDRGLELGGWSIGGLIGE